MDINKGIVCNIINKARTISITEDLVMPDNEDDLSETEWKQILAEYQNDLSYIELKNLINDLEPDQQKNIITLMYIGRGDFERSEWQTARTKLIQFLKPIVPTILSQNLCWLIIYVKV